MFFQKAHQAYMYMYAHVHACRYFTHTCTIHTSTSYTRSCTTRMSAHLSIYRLIWGSVFYKTLRMLLVHHQCKRCQYIIYQVLLMYIIYVHRFHLLTAPSTNKYKYLFYLFKLIVDVFSVAIFIRVCGCLCWVFLNVLKWQASNTTTM
jgi:hypothetical protein